MSTENCIFCKIIAKTIPAEIIYEDEEFLAFNDIRPAAPIHFLIIPKLHLPSLADCSAEHAGLLGRMLTLAPRLAAEQGCTMEQSADGSRSGGFKSIINTGPDGGQEVYHLHLHVLGGAKPWRG